MQLDQVVERIDLAFGEELPFSERVLTAEDRTVLDRVFSDQGYQGYMQDQVNRQIIRDYLLNAMLLGFLDEEQLASITPRISTPEGRANLSLNMLMSSVEQAAEVLAAGAAEDLSPLRPEPGSPPHIRLIHP